MGDVSVSIAIDNSLPPPPPFPSPIVQMDLYRSMLAKVWIKEVTTCSNFPGVQDSEEAKKEKEEKDETPAEEEVKHEDNEWGKLGIMLSLSCELPDEDCCTGNYCETHKTVNTRNIMEYYCFAQGPEEFRVNK